MAVQTEPLCPLTPELRSDIAYRRAQGVTWEAVAAHLSCNADAIRRATENDPAFAEVQEKAWAQATFEADADGMRRLRVLVNNSQDDATVLRAAEVLVKFARERRRDESRIAVERIRADVQRAKLDARAAELAAKHAATSTEDNWSPPKPPRTVNPARDAQVSLEKSQEPQAAAYLWGGKHTSPAPELDLARAGDGGNTTRAGARQNDPTEARRWSGTP